MSLAPHILSRRPWRRLFLLGLAATVLTGCAGHADRPARGAAAYVVSFAATRTADHAPIATASVPVVLGSEGKVKAARKRPAENEPVLTEFLVRLNRTRQSRVYELVTRVTAREAIRNKKGKLKVNTRYLGALVPARPGETQVVCAESDPIHLEVRLERR